MFIRNKNISHISSEEIAQTNRLGSSICRALRVRSAAGADRHPVRIRDMAYVFKLISLALLFLGIVSSQYWFDIQKKSRPAMLSTIIPAQAVKMANLGLDSFTSALMWVYTIQQVVEKPQEIPELIKTVNNLDPKFSYPYAFAALLLPGFNFPNEAVTIATRGIDEADPDWRIPYYLATTYHMFLKDRKNAAFYFEKAAITPGAPENIKIIATRYGTRQTFRDQTKEIWVSIYETTDDDFIKERAKNHIIHIEIIEVIEKAVSIYKTRYGTNPKKIIDLVDKKILKTIPPSPFGVEFYLSEKGEVLIR